jgi:DNA-binding transcriptional LysR family regulator
MSGRQYYKEVRFEHYRTFSTVARAGSFAEAGRLLRLSRPTVWQQIAALERELGAKLLVRAGRGVELTGPGRILLELVQPTVAAMASLSEAFCARLQEQGGVLRLASIQGNDLRGALTRFRKEFPRIHLTLVEQRSIDVIRSVENGRADLGLAMFSPEMGSRPAVHYEPLGDRDFTMILPERHPLARKKSLGPADLVRFPLITFLADNPLRRHLARVFERADLLQQMHVAIESESAESVENCAYLGLGVGITLLSRERRPPPGLVYRSLASSFGGLPLRLVWEKGTHLLPHVAGFVRLAKECCLQPAR